MYALIPGLGPQEILLLLILGIFLFGRKLPDLGRSLGKTIVEFKKGVGGLEDEISSAGSSNRPALEPEATKPPQRITPSAPAFSDAPNSVPPKV
jgi:sec-independent protein translocase protein TatA